MVDLMGYSVLVDNEEQARKLQEIAIEQGFKWKSNDKKIKNLGEESFQFGDGGKKIITYNYSGNHYQDKHITKKAHFNDLFRFNFVPTDMCDIVVETLEQLNMKLTKENVYVSLQGKSKEELTDLWEFLTNNGEVLFAKKLDSFCKYTFDSYPFSFSERNLNWCIGEFSNKTEVTIEQLKEILKPMETLQEKEQRLLKELEEVRKEVEDSKIKVGDWGKFWDDGSERDFVISKLCNYDLGIYYNYYGSYDNAEKITNPQLIILLENEVK